VQSKRFVNSRAKSINWLFNRTRNNTKQFTESTEVITEYNTLSQIVNSKCT